MEKGAVDMLSRQGCSEIRLPLAYSCELVSDIYDMRIWCSTWANIKRTNSLILAHPRRSLLDRSLVSLFNLPLTLPSPVNERGLFRYWLQIDC